MTNNRLNRLIMLHLLTILTLALSACGPDSREICQSHDDCLPCEQCKNGTCVLDESRLNACGECDQPDPEESAATHRSTTAPPATTKTAAPRTTPAQAGSVSEAR
jgi:hypothetical protein